MGCCVDVGLTRVDDAAMHAVSCSEAHANLDALIDKAAADGAPIAITVRRSEGAVLVSASQWAAIQETLFQPRSPSNPVR